MYGWINLLRGPGLNMSCWGPNNTQVLPFSVLCVQYSFLCWNMTWPHVCSLFIGHKLIQDYAPCKRNINWRSKNTDFDTGPQDQDPETGPTRRPSSCQRILCVSRTYSRLPELSSLQTTYHCKTEAEETGARFALLVIQPCIYTSPTKST